METASDKQHAHELIEQLPASQIDDEPETEEERQAVAEATEWLKHNQPIPFEQVLAGMGLTLEVVKNLCRQVDQRPHDDQAPVIVLDSLVNRSTVSKVRAAL
jgi:hypothetical protein